MSRERHTILIVDDDEELVDVLKEHFQKRNCETLATTDPATVVDKLRNFTVKLMLLDLKMRRIDGFDVLDKIRGAGMDLPPTIIITGFLPKYQEKLKQYSIDAADVVTKPFTFDVIEQKINRKLGGQIVSSEVGSEYEDKIYAANRCRIALVEDEGDLLQYLSDFFSERNYTVFCFRNGAEALAALEKDPVQIVLTDIKLPGLPGDKLIEALNRMPDPPAMIPISADPLSVELDAKLKGLGCEAFISKPFDVVELIEKVKMIALQKGLLG